MGINIGNSSISNLRIGNSDISKVMLGDTQVWPEGITFFSETTQGGVDDIRGALFVSNNPNYFCVNEISGFNSMQITQKFYKNNDVNQLDHYQDAGVDLSTNSISINFFFEDMMALVVYDEIRMYSLNNTGNIGDGFSETSRIYLSSMAGDIKSFHISSDGYKAIMHVKGSGLDNHVYQCNFTTPYDLSTMTYSKIITLHPNYYAVTMTGRHLLAAAINNDGDVFIRTDEYWSLFDITSHLEKTKTSQVRDYQVINGQLNYDAISCYPNGDYLLALRENRITQFKMSPRFGL